MLKLSKDKSAKLNPGKKNSKPNESTENAFELMGTEEYLENLSTDASFSKQKKPDQTSQKSQPEPEKDLDELKRKKDQLEREIQERIALKKNEEQKKEVFGIKELEDKLKFIKEKRTLTERNIKLNDNSRIKEIKHLIGRLTKNTQIIRKLEFLIYIDENKILRWSKKNFFDTKHKLKLEPELREELSVIGDRVRYYNDLVKKGDTFLLDQISRLVESYNDYRLKAQTTRKKILDNLLRIEKLAGRPKQELVDARKQKQEQEKRLALEREKELQRKKEDQERREKEFQKRIVEEKNKRKEQEEQKRKEEEIRRQREKE
ncbi:MAG: hypothetical protein ABIJ08_04175, partial [Nanoarchaeota archaeon]